MIEKTEYLDALELIDNYHRQENDRNKGAKIRHLLDNDEFSVRLANAINLYCKFYDESTIFTTNLYVHDIDTSNLAKIRNVGNSTISELKKLRREL